MANWRILFPARILSRGEIYYDNLMIKSFDLAQDNEHFAATIQGGVGQYYNVSGRLRLDGRASELKCNCPWAKKGHRCKHEVAALLATENEQKTNKKYSTTQGTHFSDLLSEDIKESIIKAQPAVNPLDIIGDKLCNKQDYQTAMQLKLNLTEISCDHLDNKMRSYEYIWHLEQYDGSWVTLDVQFTRWQIIAIDFNAFHKLSVNQEVINALTWLKFIPEYLKDDPFDITNDAALQLLSLYSTKPKEDNDPIVLRAQTNNYGSMLSIQFKLGKGKHLYQLKDLNHLIDMVHDQQPIKLGKFFNEVIDSEKMDTSSKRWLDFIKKIVDARNLNKWGYSTETLDRIDVSDSIADEVNDLLYQGSKLYSGTRLVGYTTDKLTANIQIEEENGSAHILVEDFPTSTLITGNDNFYGYYKGVWIKYESLTPKYLAQLGLHPGEELRFSKKNVTEFTRKVLPKLEQSDYLEISGANKLRAILPPEANFTFKFDYQDNNALCQALVQYGKNTYLLNRNFSQTERREAKRENEIEQLVKQYFSDFKNNEYLLSNDDLDRLGEFLDHGIAKFKEIGEVQITPTFRSLLKSTNTKMELGVSVNLTNELIDVDISSQKMSWEDIQAALKEYQEKRRYFVLSNGLLQHTQQPTIEQLAQTLHDLDISFTDFIHGKLQLPAYRAFYFAKEMQKANSLHFSSNEAFNQLINDLSKNQVKPSKLPTKLKSVLRPYQKEGFNWLSTLVNYNFGGILADEMGLGKTLQVIALLLARKKKNSTSLVVAPASVIYNWQNEAQKFAPELKTAVLGGTKKERALILSNANNYDLLITSYQSLNRDLESYQGLAFDIQILDEAQNIKNHQSITAQSAKVIKAHHKLALTGTPIENKLSELWSIFDYLMPNFLGSYLNFKKKFEIPIIKEEDENAENQLVEMVTPFILRRLKKDVLNDLPAKDEEIVYVTMGTKQAELYKLQTQKLIAELARQGDAEFKRAHFQIFAQITKLREICCDPHLLYENYHGNSGKLIMTIKLIKANIENGHKILLFSQFTSMLEIIQNKLAKLKIPIFVITGVTAKKERQEKIRQFNTLNKPGIFLISLKAGGTGINLTSADVVIHYDPWWNLAAENQASDRAHRMGQKHTVKIYKMVTRDSIEEKIISLQHKKADLAKIILDNHDVAQATMSKENLLKILK